MELSQLLRSRGLQSILSRGPQQKADHPGQEGMHTWAQSNVEAQGVWRGLELPCQTVGLCGVSVSEKLLHSEDNELLITWLMEISI